MDWEDIIPGILAFLATIWFSFLLFGRKKAGQKKLKELCQHLQLIGVKSFIADNDSAQEKIKKPSWPNRSEGVIEVKDKNIDYINIVSLASQYSVQYFLDYQVKAPKKIRRETVKKTKMIKKKGSSAKGKAMQIKWKGDPFFAQRLNFDYQLKHRLEKADLKSFKGNIWIFPESKHKYTRIRTSYHLPSPDIFEAINTIAYHIKSGA